MPRQVPHVVHVAVDARGEHTAPAVEHSAGNQGGQTEEKAQAAVSGTQEEGQDAELDSSLRPLAEHHVS